MSDEEKQLPLFPNDGLPELLEEPSEEEGKGAVSDDEQVPLESEQPPLQEQAETAQIPSESEQQQEKNPTSSPPPLPQQEAYETFIHDPWASVTTPAPTVLTAASAAETGVPPVASPLRSSRFTRGRIVAFAAVCLAVVVAFGGGAVALVNATRPTTPVEQPIQQATLQSTARPSPPAGPTAAPTTTTTTPAMHQQMFQDDFHRGNSTGGWGTASGGQTWTITTPERAGAFSVVNNEGQIKANQIGAAYYTATIGPSFQQDVEVAATMTLPAFDEQQTNAGVVLHWQDANNYDKAFLDGVQLVILENKGGKQTTLAVMNFPALDDGTAYVLRFRATSNTLMAKAWVSQKQEPAAWMLSTGEGKLTAGQVGIRARLQPGNSMRVLAFQIVA